MTVPAASWRSRRFCAASSRLCCSFCAALIELFPASTSPAPPAFSSSSKRSVWYVRAEGGLGWGLPPPVPGLWAPLKVLALTGRMGCAGGCPAGLRESLLALRRWEGRVEIASGRGAWSHILFVGVPTGSRSMGAKHAHGRREIRRRMRGRNASTGHARACRGADGPNGRVTGRERRRRGRGRSRKRPVAKGPEGPGEVPPGTKKGRHRRDTPRRGYAMNGPVTHPMGRPSSPSPSMLNASSLRNMSTRARRRLGLELLSFDQMKGRELFRWLTDRRGTSASWD